MVMAIILLIMAVIAIKELTLLTSGNPPVKRRDLFEDDIINDPMKAWHPLNRFNSSRDERGW